MDLKEINSNYSNNLYSAQDLDKQKQIGLKDTLGNSSAGIGQMYTSYLKSFLPKNIAPTALKVAAGTPRFLGAAGTIATFLPSVYNTFMEDKKIGDYTNTRKKVFVTSSSVAASMAVGSAAGILTAGATVLGAPALVIGGLVAGGIGATVYTAYKAANWAGNFFDSFRK